MFVILTTFLIFNVFYQVFSTLTVYGLEIFWSSIPSLLRDGFWCIFFLSIILRNYKSLKAYLKQRKKKRIAFLVLLAYSVLISYLFLDKNAWDILVGIKYGFWRIGILLSSTFIGFAYQNNLNANKSKYQKILYYALWAVVIWWFIWQFLKLVKPERFAHMGYTIHLDNYQFWAKPPIYYLTGYEGSLRRQGFFSWPNNYGYFLIAFLPLLLPKYKSWTELSKEKKFSMSQKALLILRMIAMFLTLSRAVILGALVVLLLFYRPNLSQNTKNKKKILIACGVFILTIIWFLSLLKRDSTLAHITSKLSALPKIFSHPLGLGLGSSGPAIHHNGSILPENYYFQILLDIGFIGFGLRCRTILTILKNRRKDAQDRELPWEIIGFIGLLTMWLVLHVFEDSMVNYLFFIIFWIILWSKKIDFNEK